MTPLLGAHVWQFHPFSFVFIEVPAITSLVGLASFMAIHYADQSYLHKAHCFLIVTNLLHLVNKKLKTVL